MLDGRWRMEAGGWEIGDWRLEMEVRKHKL